MRMLLPAAFGPIALLAASTAEARLQAVGSLPLQAPSTGLEAPADADATSPGLEARLRPQEAGKVEIRPGSEEQPDWILEAAPLPRTTWLLVAPIGRLHEGQAGELEAFGWALRLDRGTETAPHDGIDLELGAVGALYDFEVGPRSTVIRLQAPDDAFGEAVEILTERLTRLELGPEDKQDVLTALATSGALDPNPERDLEAALTRQLLGPDHPLSRELNVFALFAGLDLAAVRDRWLAALAAGQHGISGKRLDDAALAQAQAGWTRLVGNVEPWNVPAETLMLARPASHARPTLHVPAHELEDPYWMLVEARAVGEARSFWVPGYEHGFHVAWSHRVLERPAWSAAVPGRWLTHLRTGLPQFKDLDSEGLPRAFDTLEPGELPGEPGLGTDPLTEHVLARVVPAPSFEEVTRAQAFAMVAEGMAPPPVIGDGKVGGVEIEGFEGEPVEARTDTTTERTEWPAPPKCEWRLRTDRSAFAQSTPDGQRVAQRILNRLGGAQRWAELEGLVFEAENTLGAGQAPMRTIKTSDLDSGDMQLDIHMRGTVQTMHLEDGRAFVEQQGRELVLPADRSRRMALGERTSLAHLLHRLALQAPLGVRYAEPDLVVFDELGEVARLGLDEEGWVRSIASDDGTGRRYVEFTGYTEVDGLWFAKGYSVTGPDGSRTSTRVTDIQTRFAPGNGDPAVDSESNSKSE